MRNLVNALTAVAVMLALVGCSSGGGSTSTRPPIETPEVPPKVPSIERVVLLGEEIFSLHLEATDYFTKNTGETGTTYQFPTTSGPQEFRPGDLVRRKMTCPGLEHNGNDCTVTHYEVRGTIYEAVDHPNVPTDRSIGTQIAVYLNNAHSVDSIHGFNMFRAGRIGPEGLGGTYGGISEYSVFYAAGSDRSLSGPFDVFSSFGASFGNLHGYGDFQRSPDESATYRGAMVGRTIQESFEVSGKSEVRYDFAASEVDVILSEIAATPNGGAYSGDSILKWGNVRVNDDWSFDGLHSGVWQRPRFYGTLK